jgi:hypothetical protein
MDSPQKQFRVILRDEIAHEFLDYYPFLRGFLQANNQLFACARIETMIHCLVMSGFEGDSDLEVYLPHEFVLYYVSLEKGNTSGFAAIQMGRVDGPKQ